MFGIKLLMFEIKLLVFGIKLLMFGIKLLVSGIKLLMIGIKLLMFGIKLLVFGIKLLVFGIKLLMFGIKLLVYGIKLLVYGIKLLNIFLFSLQILTEILGNTKENSETYKYTVLFKMIVWVQMSSDNSAPNSGNNHHLTISFEGSMHSFKRQCACVSRN